MNRRDFLKTSGAVGAGVGLTALSGSPSLAADLSKGAPNAEKLGWRLGCQSYTFNRFTFFDAVDKTASLGLHYIEGYPGQPISKKLSAAMGADMTVAQRSEVLKKLSDSGVKLVNFGVGGYDRKQFEFAKEMGVETLVAEPNEGDFDAVDKLCSEFQINLAIHDHPKPSHYWNPDTVLKVCRGRSKRIGACADTGHWARSGLNPVECLKKLAGRIVSFHFKDLNKMGMDAHDVPWGTGICGVKAMLREIRRQGLKAVFSIEYEYHWENSLPEIAKCVAYFDSTAINLAAMDLNMPGRGTPSPQ
ncbi:MAG: TIM barrel protein [Thermoguttaceae bacterium]